MWPFKQEPINTLDDYRTKSTAIGSCIEIFEDFGPLDIIKQPHSVQHAWEVGRHLKLDIPEHKYKNQLNKRGKNATT